MEPVRVPKALRRSAPIVLVMTILALAAAAVLTALQQPTYSATSKVFVSTGAASSITDLNLSSAFTQQVVKSYVDVATTPYVLTPVINELRLPVTPAQLASRVSASAPIGTVVIEISATAPAPAQAAAIANGVSDRLGAAVLNLSPATTSAASAAVTITPLQAAVANPRPTSPNVLLNLFIGAIAGIVVGILLALLRDRFDTRIRDLDDVVRATGSSVVGTVGLSEDTKEQGIIGGRQSVRDSEAFRTVKAHLALLDQRDGRRSLVVTAAAAGQGTSYVAANVAASIAASGRKVLLVEADLRSPSLAAALGLPEGVGLSDVLGSSVGWPSALQQSGPTGMQVMPAGEATGDPGELLQSEAMRELMEHLEQSFDVVVYDAPDMGRAIDAAVLGKNVSGVLFVCALDRADAVDVADTVSELEELGGRIIGVVATSARGERRRGSAGLGRRSRRGLAVGGAFPTPAAD